VGHFCADIQDHMHVAFGRQRRVHLSETLEELLMLMAAMIPADDFARRDVQPIGCSYRSLAASN
jgi:hypothetical protein